MRDDALGKRPRTGTVIGLATVVLLAPVSALTQDTLPAAFTNSEFWSLTEEMSEPDRAFRSNSGSSDNLLSNENEVAAIAAVVAQRVTPSGAYLGVGPEQNFTYIAASRPRIAFIADIRRGNLHLHLMYKALFEMSSNRAEFVGRLFSRARPAGLSTSSTAAELMNAYLAVAPAEAHEVDTNLTALTTYLTRTRGLPLAADDLAGIAYVYRNFHRYGPDIRYNSTGGRASSGHTYAALMSLTDATGSERGYLGTEASFTFVKNLHSRNLIVPVVGDFAGPKALRAVGAFLRKRGALLTAFYVSNVESYLQREGTWAAFCRNVASMPIDRESVFIRPAGSRTSLSFIASETSACATAK